MADTTTPLLGLLLQGTGGNNNSWGTNLNGQVITPIEAAIAGTVGASSTGGTYTLSPAEARSGTIYFQGTLTSDLVIVVPDTDKVYRIWNLLGGAFFTTLKCATGATAVSIPGGGAITTVIAVIGVPRRQDRMEVGRYVYDAIAATADVLECNGAAYKRASLPDLFAKIGTTFGSTDSTDFKVPNAYDTGRFLRSRSASLAVGTSQANQNKAHTHTGSGTTLGESVGHTHTGSGTTSTISNDHTHTQQGTFTSGDDSPDHTHGFTAVINTANNVITYGGGLNNVASGSTASTTAGANQRHAHSVTISGQTGGISANHTHTYSFTTSNISVGHTHTYSFTTSSDGGTEARPESLVGILCIRY